MNLIYESSQPNPEDDNTIIVSATCWEIQSGVVPGGWDCILSWALTEENEPVLIRIENYPSSFFFEFQEQDRIINQGYAKLFHERLSLALGENSKYLMPLSPEDLSVKTKLYYGRQATMLKLHFINQDSARHAKNILAKGLRATDSFYGERIYGSCHETEQDVDIFRKLLSEVQVKHCGWYRCIVKRLLNEEDKMSTQKREYITLYQSMKPYVTEAIPRPLWCDFDLEVYSHNHGQFPRHWNSKDVIHTASMTFRRDGESEEKWIQYCVCTYNHMLIDNDMKCVTIIRVEDEEEFIQGYARLIREMDPDLISGYNIMQFDNKYLDARITRMGEWPVLGRLKNKSGPVHNISWASSAYREKDMYIPDNSGRQYLDLMEQLMRTYISWNTYTLENAAKQIFPNDPSKRKQDVSPRRQFEIYKAVRDATTRGDVDLYYELLERKSITEDEGRFCLEVRQILIDAGTLIRYCMYDSRIVGHIANSIFFWIGIREMCNIAGVQPQGLLTRGQQYKVISMLYDACQKEGVVLDKRALPEQFFYRGGLVQKPIPGFVKKVLTVDFKSLYPNVMIKYWLCYMTLIHRDDWHKYTPDQYTVATPDISDIDEDALDEDEDKPKKNKKNIVYRQEEFRFLKPHVRQAILPKILRNLLDARAVVRKIKTDDPQKKIVYDQRQLALKVSANSVYGFTGVRKGPKRQCLEITAATCFFGRFSIGDTIEWIIAKYNAKLIYGDTDSCMMELLDGYIGDMHKYAQKIAAEASEAQAPLELEMEGIYDMFCVKQKMYTKCTYKNRAWDQTPGEFILDSEGNPDMMIKGLAPARRDNCKWARETISSIILMIMQQKGYYACVHYLIHRVKDMYDGLFKLEEFVISKGLSSGYKLENASMKVFSEEMAKAGLTLEAGQRHEFVVIDVPGVKHVGKRMLLLSVYNSKIHKLDYNYYFNNLLKAKTDTILYAEYSKYSDKLAGLHLKVRGKDITGTKPASLISAFIKEGGSLDVLDQGMYKVGRRIGVPK